MTFIRIREQIINIDSINHVSFKSYTKLKTPVVDQKGRKDYDFKPIDFSLLASGKLNKKYTSCQVEATINFAVTTVNLSNEEYLSRIKLIDDEAIALWNYFHAADMVVVLDK